MPFSLNREKRYSLKQQKSAKNNCGRGGGRPDNWVTILQHLPTQGNIDFRQDIQDYLVLEWSTAKTFFVGKEPTRDQNGVLLSRFQPDNLGIVGTVLVMGETQALATHPVMGLVCVPAARGWTEERDVTNVSRGSSFSLESRYFQSTKLSSFSLS